jgi:O-antigen/teichoic acid export membrane protein
MGTLRKALFWSAMQRFGIQGSAFLLSITLARLLSPKEYGLVGMLMVFCGIGQVFADSGLSTALVQRPANSADDEATVFYLNIGAGAVLTLFICAISPLVAKFYGQPILIPLLCVLSLQVFLSSFGIVQFALLTRAMDFRRLAMISTLSVLASGAVGIGMALNGLGVWSLAGQSVSGALFSSLLVWRLGNWRLTGHFRRASFQAMWSFSSRLLASGLLDTVFENLYNVIIGRVYRPADLGFFTRARSLAQLPAGFVVSIFSQTTLPAFSRIKDDVKLLKSNVRKVIRILTAVHFPAMAAMAVVADPLVRFLLTDKWAPCVPYLQVLSIAGILYPLHVLHLNVLTAQGRSDLLLRVEIIKKVFIFLAIACTFRFGISVMVWGILFFSVIFLALNGYYTRKLLNYRWREQALDLAPVIGASAVMVMAMSAIFYLKFKSTGVWLLHFDINHPLTLLLVQLAVGLTVYGCITGLSRMSTYVEFRSLVFSYFWPGSERRAGGNA